MVDAVPDNNPPILLGIFPGPRRFPIGPQGPSDSSSRLCEICWCDNTLFSIGSGTSLVILDEATYRILKQINDRDFTHGSLGEQFLVKHLLEANPLIDSEVNIGDAILRVIALVNLQILDGTCEIPAELSSQLIGLKATITEEGLIEPGAPIQITNPQINTETQS